MPKRSVKKRARERRKRIGDGGPTLKDLVAKITRGNRHRETLIGVERGKEKVHW